MRHDDAAALGIPRAACHNAVDVAIGILANALSPGTQPPLRKCFGISRRVSGFALANLAEKEAPLCVTLG